MKGKITVLLALLTVGLFTACELTISPGQEVGVGTLIVTNLTTEYTISSLYITKTYGTWGSDLLSSGLTPNAGIAFTNQTNVTYYYYMILHNDTYGFDLAYSNAGYQIDVVKDDTVKISMKPGWIGISNKSVYSVSNFILIGKSTFDFCSILIEGAGDVKVNHIDAGISHEAAPDYTNWYEMFPSEIPAGIYNVFIANGVRPTNRIVYDVTITADKTNMYKLTSLPWTPYPHNGLWYWNGN